MKPFSKHLRHTRVNIVLDIHVRTQKSMQKHNARKGKGNVI